MLANQTSHPASRTTWRGRGGKHILSCTLLSGDRLTGRPGPACPGHRFDVELGGDSMGCGSILEWEGGMRRLWLGPVIDSPIRATTCIVLSGVYWLAVNRAVDLGGVGTSAQQNGVRYSSKCTQGCACTCSCSCPFARLEAARASRVSHQCLTLPKYLYVLEIDVR